ncbi:hypothetical protein SAMN05878482_10533 [Peribacillus simplex]|uniref:Uncharacterized protein n=1 Tax=Peribacillus simplex TaxID=1478 RepID=A0A9X8WLH1_9BACI|nr:hypothetical protein [Peribacillus simplex]SIR68672.1 hypothetical protein SAMN05878482_10533 [Peribacillus simplex]
MENLLDVNDTPRPESIKFFLDVISKHQSVKSVKQIGLPLFKLIKKNDSELRVLLVNIYILSESEFLDIFSRYQNIDAIVNSSNWNDYTGSAKNLAKEHNIGLFNFKEFMGALNYDNKHFFINYITAAEREENKKNNRSIF